MNYLCKLHNVLSIICLSMVIVCTAGNVWADDSDDNNPLRFWKGENKSYLQFSFWNESVFAVGSNSWFGKDRENIGAASGSWFENVFFPKLDGSYVFDDKSQIYGRVSVVAAFTEGYDAAGSNEGRSSTMSMISWQKRTRMEDMFLGWRSGNAFSSLGKDFLDVSFGRQRYQVGDGLLFWGQSGNSNRRGANWIGDRHAADYSGIIRLREGGWASDLVYYKIDDTPNSNTKVGGGLLEYNFSDKRAGNRLNYADNDGPAYLGGGVYHVDSDEDTRDKMIMYYMRGAIKPFEALCNIPALKPFRVEAEYVHQNTDDDDIGDGDGWYIEPRYQFVCLPWKPMLIYRYSSFDKDYWDGGYGDGQWDKWNQGEILGEFALENINLNTNTINLRVFPTKDVTLNLVYLKFRLDDADAFGVDSKNYANELDLIVDYNFNDHLSISWVGGWAKPGSGAKQSTGGDTDWLHTMIYTCISF